MTNFDQDDHDAPSLPSAGDRPPRRDLAADTRRLAQDLTVEFENTQRKTVLEFLRKRGDAGATDAEISVGLRIPINSITARRCSLRDAGQVVDSGRRRQNPSGCSATVWTVAVVSMIDVQPVNGEDLPPLPPRALAAGTGPDRCRCRSSAWVEVRTGTGSKTRIDCRLCGRFLKWGRW
jgi:hypothetical protein